MRCVAWRCRAVTCGAASHRSVALRCNARWRIYAVWINTYLSFRGHFYGCIFIAATFCLVTSAYAATLIWFSCDVFCVAIEEWRQPASAVCGKIDTVSDDFYWRINWSSKLTSLINVQHSTSSWCMSLEKVSVYISIFLFTVRALQEALLWQRDFATRLSV